MDGEGIYDYAIVGTGAAGFQLALHLVNDTFFHNKRILLIDKDPKVTNDRTWCFWEKGEGPFDEILHHSWRQAGFYSNKIEKEFSIAPYSYKMVRGVDFYNYAKQIVEESPNVDVVLDEVSEIDGGDILTIRGNHVYRARMAFDSRVEDSFYSQKSDYNTLMQHFLGWEVSFDTPIFDPEKFVMMDFRHQWKDTTSFMYILPFSEKRALLEYTLFSADLLQEGDYEAMISSYIEQYLPKGIGYEIHSKEKGIIPMTDFPFTQKIGHNYIRIGTAGGWVKGSSGYSFRAAHRFSKKIAENLKHGRSPVSGLMRKRFKWYDSVFLDVLSNHNDRGADLFTEMYTNNTPEQILKFLDEDTQLLEEIPILNSFTKGPFLRAVLRRMLP